MANYDGPTYSYPTVNAGIEADETLYVLYWTTQPTWAQAPPFGPGGGGGSTPSDQDINGYGYSHSG